VLPARAPIGRLEDAIADRQVRPVKSLAGADIDDVGMRRRHRHIAHRTGGRIVEDRVPGATEVVRLPDAAVVHADVEDVGLRRDPNATDRTAGAEGSDRAVPQLLVQSRVHRGLLGRRAEK